MPAAIQDLEIERNAPINTWFKVGGGARRLAHPQSTRQLQQCLDIDASLRLLGSGANLLVDDDGIEDLIVSLDAPHWKQVEIDPRSGYVRAGAGADLARLILDCQRAGLAGLENLGGIPATLGGAIHMNAGGRFGQIADFVRTVHAFNRQGEDCEIPRHEIPFAYRESGLEGLIITGVELTLLRDDPPAIRERLIRIMQEKKISQPMGSNCAGCCFKNPTLVRNINDIGSAGQRVSAGLVIDRAGCKGMIHAGARVSLKHANFITANADAKARDVIQLIEQVRSRVADKFGIELQTEIDIWESSR